MTTGYVPTALEQALITPLLKNTGLDVNTAANCRPVWNLFSQKSKLLQMVQIEKHLSREGQFPSHQSAYRKHHSTELVLTRVCSDISRLDQ